MATGNRILEAITALRAFDRASAVALLEEELRQGPRDGERWKSVCQLAGTIGEIEIALEAARRYAQTPPQSLERMLYYWGELSAQGRSAQAQGEALRLPASLRDNPGVLHFIGTLAVQDGDFAKGEECFRAAIAQTPCAPQTWFALAMMKSFERADDPDIAEMERMRLVIARGADPILHARFLYGLAKAWHECGEYERAFGYYREGARLRQDGQRYDLSVVERIADRLIEDFTSETMKRLTPSGERGSRAIFVNGLPRSGTTLVEQILTSHSMVSDGGELNYLKAALIPAGDYTMAGALAAQQRGGDPWGDANRQYHRMLEMRFGSEGRVVDKTLLHSHYMGLLLHSLPDARVVWLRRRAEDAALSCFRTYFTASVPWSWSLPDIARMFRIEDRLFAHWTALFPDRILTVPYEELVADPQDWIPRILTHAGLCVEPQTLEPHKQQRSVRTASVKQVRAPISASSVGYSGKYGEHIRVFQEHYHA